MLQVERQKLHQYPMEKGVGFLGLKDFWRSLPDSDPERHPGCGWIPSGITCPACGKELGEPLPDPYCYQSDVMEDDHLTIQIAGGEQVGKSQVSAAKFVRILMGFLSEYGESGDAAGEAAWIVADSYELTRQEFELAAFWLSKFLPRVEHTKDIAPGFIRIYVKGGVFTVRTRTANDARTLRAESPVAALVCEDAMLVQDAWTRLISRVTRSRARFPGYGAIVASGTFEGSLGWKPTLWTKWQSKANQQRENSRSFSLPTFSNVFVYPGGEKHPEIVALKNQLSFNEYSERILAVPAPPKGRVHQGFDVTRHVVEVDYDAEEAVYIGVDPGYSGQPSTYAVEVYQRRQTECGYRHFQGIDEIYERQLTVPQICQLSMSRFWWRNSLKVGVIDVAGKAHAGAQESNVETWQKETGLNLMNQRVQILPGIRRMDSMLMDCPKCHEPYLTFSPSQKGVISELGGCGNPFDGLTHIYSWQTDRTGNPVGNVPRDEWCDGIKATTYLFYNQFGATNIAADRKAIRVRTRRQRMEAMRA